MPLFYQQDINPTTRLGVWKIEEPEDFFLRSVTVQSAVTHPLKRLQHLAGRFLLPFLFPDFPFSDIEIADTKKPYLPGEQFHFSISHSADYAAAIVSSTERVGVDIEMITPRLNKIKHKFLHPEELVFVNSYPEADQIKLLTVLWSAKEAMFKWWGNGNVDFSEVLRITNFSFQQKGIIEANFIKGELDIPLLLHYELMGGLSLVSVSCEL